MKPLRFLLVSLLLCCVLNVSAEIKLPKVIGDNMILQQGKNVAVWGDADPGETVTVKFAKQTVRVKADAEGKWSVALAPMEVSKTPREMTVSGKKEKITLKNILVGEVWLASGQSNMEYSMNRHPQYKKPAKGDPDILQKEFSAAENPLIRVLYVEKKLDTAELPTSGWHEAVGEELAPVSAAGYFFAKKLFEELDVPVGIISSSWGGTAIETWTPVEAYLESPLFADKMKGDRLEGQEVGRRYGKMIEPLIPYTLKGFIWYQGETSLINGDMMNYADKMKVLVDSWRSLWNDNDMPFYYVQISPMVYSQRRDHVAKDWQSLPHFWEVQTLALDIPNTGMIVTTDLVDNPRDIHPSYKWIVGERLSRLALAKDYDKKVEYSGPVFKKMAIDGNKAVIEFDHVESGLVTSDGKAPDWFQISGPDGKFVKAEAAIDGGRVVLTAKGVKEPAAVRFAWDEVAMPNLVNGEGLPAVPFRTNGEKWSYTK